jgi:hypothetical protein
MTMMLTVYCPECYKMGKHRENWPKNSLKASISDICTDAGYDLDGREPTDEEALETWLEDEDHIRALELKDAKCGLCSHQWRPRRVDSGFGCPGDHLPYEVMNRS